MKKSITLVLLMTAVFTSMNTFASNCKSQPTESALRDDPPITGGNGGPMDEYGHLVDLPSMIPDSTIYITQNTVWTTRKYVYHDVYVNSGKTLRITNNINFYRGTKLYLASGSTLIVDGATLTDVSINYAGTTGTSIQILHNGTIKCVDNQDFVVPLGVNLDVNYGKIN